MIEKIGTDLQICMRLEQDGHREEARKCYEAVHNNLITLANKETPAVRNKRMKQADLIKKKVRSLTSENEADRKTGEDYLELVEDLGVKYTRLPKRKFQDISGLDEAKKTLLVNIVYPIIYRDLSTEFNIRNNGGILLYGPP